MLFRNEVTLTRGLDNVDGSTLRQLPQFFRASPEYVYRLGGPLYRRILDAAPLVRHRRFTSIDSRIHMLMPGFWPCIPGWHCDDFHRPDGNQPDLRALEAQPIFNALHHAIVLGDTAPTEFAVEPFEIDDSLLRSSRVYHACNELLERKPPASRRIVPGEFASFDSLVWHRGTRAEKQGWRLFVRISQSEHYQPLNEIRTQTQVYLSDAGAGW